jgi:hypothetical protein
VVPHCIVSITGKDGERHMFEMDVINLFDAACKAQQQFSYLWWFRRDVLMEVKSGNDRWFVRQDGVRKWATGSLRRRRTE